MDKTFTIVGVSTQGKVTKFRVANGDMAQRIKVLERNGHTDINLITLPNAMNKMDAIAAYKAEHPDAADIRVPNDKDNADGPTKTVTVRRAGTKVTDAATELLNQIEEEV